MTYNSAGSSVPVQSPSSIRSSTRHHASVLNGEFQFPGHGSPPLQFRKNETGTRSASRSARAQEQMKYAERSYFAIRSPWSTMGARGAESEEELIARKYDKADGKRFVGDAGKFIRGVGTRTVLKRHRADMALAEINEDTAAYFTNSAIATSLGNPRVMAFVTSVYSSKCLGISSRDASRYLWKIGLVPCETRTTDRHPGVIWLLSSGYWGVDGF